MIDFKCLSYVINIVYDVGGQINITLTVYLMLPNNFNSHLK